MRLSFRATIAVLLLFAVVSSAALPALAQDKGGKLRFGVGPLQPTPSETTKAYEPFFAYVAKKLNREFDLVATTDWAGISVALANDQVDVAWMGPWGYVLANTDSGVTAIATAKYDGKPIYHAIVVCKPGHGIKTWPQDGKGKRVSFADVGSIDYLHIASVPATGGVALSGAIAPELVHPDPAGETGLKTAVND